MVVKEANLLFQAGALDTPIIKKYDLEGGWVVMLNGRHPLMPTLETARGKVRVFKRLDVAVGVLFEMGFSNITVSQ